MTRFPEFPKSQGLRGLIAALFAATSVPGLVWAADGKPAPAANDKDAPIYVWSEQLHGRPDREVHLDTDVEVLRGPTHVFSDTATYHIVEDEVEASGHVRMLRLGDHYTGDELKLRLDTGQGYLTHPTYHLLRNNAQGKAQQMDFLAEDQATVIDGDYSTCEGPNPDWYLKSSKLDLDSGRDVGTAHNAVLIFQGVPILGAPSISFPLSDARKSGFLPPTLVTTNRGGSELTTPYYFNIAPNRDLTLYPNIITRRGLQMGADARYLEPDYWGDTRIEGLAGDRERADPQNRTRYAITSIHNQVLAPGWGMSWNFNAASDGDYPADFSHSITNAATQRQLDREFDLTYGQPDWNVLLRVKNYQELPDSSIPDQVVYKPYALLPQVSFKSLKPNVAGFDIGFDSEITRFTSSDHTRVDGTRFVAIPRISFPMVSASGFLTPKLMWNYASYNLAIPPVTATTVSTNANPTDVEDATPAHLSRSIPTISLDGGLVFERPTTIAGQDFTQTLEPRLFYVRTPYRDQRKFPLFDTALADLTFVQIFNENRFLGNDLVGDANQLTFAATSRLIEPGGAERARFAIAQREYFSNQQVSNVRLSANSSLQVLDALTGASSLQADSSGTSSATPGVNGSRSDLLLFAGGQISATLSADAALEYSESNRSLARANISTHWQPAPKKILNLGYLRDATNGVNQIDVSGQWPLSNRWYGVTRLNFSIGNLTSTIPGSTPDARKLVQGLVGLEYKADCWVFRMFAQRTPTGAGQSTTSIFYQLELNGLTRLGTNPLDAIRRSVPGYQMVNQPDHL